MQHKSSSSVKVFYPKFSKEEIIQRIKEGIEELAQKMPLKKVILFGSYAKENYTVASDIDLLVVYKGRKRKDAFALCKKILKIPSLEPHVYSEAEYKALKSTIQKMTQDGIVIL